MVSRRDQEKINRRNYILGVAERLFLKNGFETTTMDEIARQAEFSKTTLYSYFRSKDELLFVMHMRDARKGYNFLKKVLNSDQDGYGKLHAYGDLFYQFYEKYPAKLITRIYLDSMITKPTDISEDAQDENRLQVERDYTLLKDIFREGMSDGSLRKDLNIDMTIGHFVYTLYPVLKQSFYSTHRFAQFNGREYYYSYLDLFLRGLRP